jgi:hypothetical protein
MEGLALEECSVCTRGRETGENGDNAGKNGNEKATDEVQRADINTVQMKMLKEEELEGRRMTPWPDVRDLRTHLMMLRA